MKNRIALIAALACVAGLLGFAPSAHAEDPNADHRPCVSKREFNSDVVARPRHELERRWEVVGLGTSHREPYFGHIVIYPRCGYSLDQGWYGVKYTLDKGLRYADLDFWWTAPGAKPNAPE